MHSDSGTHPIARRARDEAAALLKAGEIRRAADTFRDAGLDDEAVHLYVNVLGLPGEAAPLVAASGDPRRAAELYEMAGHNIRAAATWCVVAQAAAHPEIYLDRIERLDHHMAIEMLEEETAERPLSADTVELHYRYARFLAKDNDEGTARAIYQRILDTVGDYKDTRARLSGVAGMSSGSMVLPPIIGGGDDDSSSVYPAVGLELGRSSTRDTLSPDELAGLAMDVAKSAAAHLEPVDPLSQIVASANMARTRHSQSDEIALGFERQTISIHSLVDDAVEAARFGPSIESLHQLIADRPCDLQNIEVYYRLGLAHLASGAWLDAIAPFEAVEQTSPGYRDAERRAQEIRGWRDALGEWIHGFEVTVADGKSRPRYAIRGELGRGGMAVVYRAVDISNGREVALKLLSESLVHDRDAKTRFQREAYAIAKLAHPNIVRLHEAGDVDGRSFMAMEYVAGKTVDMFIADGSGHSIVESLRIVEQVLDALAYAHKLGCVHRDVKPGNMMQTPAGLVKLMDFGLSANTGDQERGLVAGSPAYMSPEQLNGKPVDHRGDIFSVGVTLYEMLTGRLPFPGFDRTAKPRPVSSRVDNCPAVLDRIVAKALAFDPDQRFQRARHMLRAIREILAAVRQYSAGPRSRISG